jgi:hypothetical protein
MSAGSVILGYGQIVWQNEEVVHTSKYQAAGFFAILRADFQYRHAAPTKVNNPFAALVTPMLTPASSCQLLTG